MTLSREDLHLPDEVILCQPSFLEGLGSIQPLGAQPQIPDVLRRKRRRYTDEDFDVLEDLEPMDMLPRELIPDRKARWQPPAMWYGWEYDEDKVLDFAMAHDLLSYTRVYLPLEDDATAANGYDPELAKTCTAREFSTDDTCMQVFMYFVRRLKIKPASGFPLNIMPISRWEINLPDEIITQPSFLDALGSIQPLNEEPKLPSILKYKRRRYTPEEICKIEELEPMDLLPRELIPNMTPYMQPPALYYGWEYDEDKVIEFARANCLLSYDNQGRRPLSELKGVDFDPVLVFYEPDCPDFYIVREFSADDTCMSVFLYFMEKLKITPASGYPLKYVLGRGDMKSIFALYGNWQLRQGLKAEDVAKLASAMNEHGLGGKPQCQVWAGPPLAANTSGTATYKSVFKGERLTQDATSSTSSPNHVLTLLQRHVDLAPLDEVPEIPPLLQRKRRRYTPQELGSLKNFEPLEMLPREFIPDMIPHWQPPAMWYGWEYDEGKVIEFAKAHDLLGYEKRRKPIAEKDNFDPALVSYDPKTPKYCTVRVYNADDTCMKVFYHFVRKLDIIPASGYPLKYVLGRGEIRSIFVLYGNWQLRQGLDLEDVAELISAMDEYGLGGKPEWWLDIVYFVSVPRNRVPAELGYAPCEKRSLQRMARQAMGTTWTMACVALATKDGRVIRQTSMARRQHGIRACSKADAQLHKTPHLQLPVTSRLFRGIMPLRRWELSLPDDIINHPSFLDDLGSIQPLDVDPEIPPLLERKRRRYTPQEIGTLRALEPLDMLPRELIPDTTGRWQPPAMWYGWEYDEDKVIEFAKAHDLVGYQNRFRPIAEKDKFDPALVSYDPKWPKYCTVRMFSVDDTCADVFHHFMEDLDIIPASGYPLKYVLGRGDMRSVFVLYGNWQLRQGLDAEDVAELVSAMDEHGLGGKPQWWLDTSQISWNIPETYRPPFVTNW
ncbi:hypothetical protein NM688_g278 [Phlebia brevispora]|uniref:Uncharacterized protein n=1 Tax=Phlebia brevispora TaxID=194682 RepID=A0ACC1TEF9_9APHY|nr:hypothetical protein NM688_g278 [Phlebia brevispora]